MVLSYRFDSGFEVRGRARPEARCAMCWRHRGCEGAPLPCRATILPSERYAWSIQLILCNMKKKKKKNVIYQLCPM